MWKHFEPLKSHSDGCSQHKQAVCMCDSRSIHFANKMKTICFCFNFNVHKSCFWCREVALLLDWIPPALGMWWAALYLWETDASDHLLRGLVWSRRKPAVFFFFFLLCQRRDSHYTYWYTQMHTQTHTCTQQYGNVLLLINICHYISEGSVTWSMKYLSFVGIFCSFIPYG